MLSDTNKTRMDLITKMLYLIDECGSIEAANKVMSAAKAVREIPVVKAKIAAPVKSAREEEEEVYAEDS